MKACENNTTAISVAGYFLFTLLSRMYYDWLKVMVTLEMVHNIYEMKLDHLRVSYMSWLNISNHIQL